MKAQRSHARAETETTVTFSLSHNFKQELIERAKLSPLDCTVSRMVRLGLEWHEKRGWQDVEYIHHGTLPSKQKKK